MALISCNECGKQISDEAKSCPNCGYSNQINYLEDIALDENKSNHFSWYVYVFVALLVIFIASKCESSADDNSINNTDIGYQGPPTFVLTEMNGRELEEEAYFIINYDNTFELKTGDGTIFKYTPTQHLGDDPLCNILATDGRGRNTAICIKKRTGLNMVIMLENNEMISNFKGYKK